MLQQYQFSATFPPVVTILKRITSLEYACNVAVIFAFAACSAVAVVCHERILKFQGATEDVQMQNMFLSFHQMMLQFALVILLLYTVTVPDDNEEKTVLADLDKIAGLPWLVALILNNAFLSLCSSFVLRYLNSISRTFSSSIDIFLVPWACFLFFGAPVYWHLAVAMALVGLALYLYAKNPVIYKGPALKRNRNSPHLGKLNYKHCTL